MSWKYSDWQEYQEAVAEAFRELGCRAEVQKTITGARGTHQIDVYVTFQKFGYECRWLIECKLWDTPVTKETVSTLHSKVQNVGADRGLIFSESGFQSGASAAAQNTNILLQNSLEDFRRTAQLCMDRIPLVLRESDQPDTPPVHVFPGGSQPYHLLKHGGRVFVANWTSPQGGNIAVIDPKTQTIEAIVELDKYEDRSEPNGAPVIRQYPPGNIACTDGKLFVGQIFSESLLVIDIDTQSIIKRIHIPGGGEGAIAASPNGKHVYFASNKVASLFIIDTATYEYEVVNYPRGGRGSMCILPHPSKPLLYIGIQRGGNLQGTSYRGGNCFLATYDMDRRRYVNSLYLAEVENGRSDNGSPHCLTYDEEQACLFVGMFQSLRGICRIDEQGKEILDEFRFTPNERNKVFPWVDPLSQALNHEQLLSVNRNNQELVVLDRRRGRILHTKYLGEAPNGPHSVVVVDNVAIVSYPERGGLIFYNLEAIG